MSNSKGNSIAHILKSLVVTIFKAILMAAAFASGVIGLFFTKLSELLGKIYGNGTSH